MGVYKRIRVAPDRDLRATRFEVAVIDTPVFQRLRTIRQLGQAHVTFPTAEHSRFAHALGTLYWAAKMLSYLRENHFADPHNGSAGNTAILDEANRSLKKTILAGFDDDDRAAVPLFEQIVRLWALLHDLTHLPFGHTLEDQAHVVPLRHDEDPERIDYAFERLVTEIQSSPHLRKSGVGSDVNLLTRMIRTCKSLYHLSVLLKGPSSARVLEGAAWETIGEFVPTAFIPYLTIVHDVVSNTICADLLDYLHRDSLMCGMPWTVDKVLFSHLKLMPVASELNGGLKGEAIRCGVAVARSKLRHDVVTAVLALLRARYDMTEKIYYHHTKCAADAILEKAIRSSKDQSTASWQTIIGEDIGDEVFLSRLADPARAGHVSSRLVKQLRSRRFHKAVFRLRRTSDWSADTKTAVDQCTTPEGRSALEETLTQICDFADEGRVIVSSLPTNMQFKEARALIEWIDGDHLVLADLPHVKHYVPEVTNLTERYRDLWALTVYLDPEHEEYVGAVVSQCERLFKRANDPLLSQYLAAKHPVPYAVKTIFNQITDESEIATARNLNVAFRGGTPRDEKNVSEVALDQLEQNVTERRGRRAPRKISDKSRPPAKSLSSEGTEPKVPIEAQQVPRPAKSAESDQLPPEPPLE